MIEELRQRLAAVGVTAEEVSPSAITVRAIHDAVGDITIEYGEGEFTIKIGSHYHKHFDSQGDTSMELDNITNFISDFVTEHSIFTIQCRGSEVVTARLDNTKSGEYSVLALCRGKQSCWSRIASLFRANHKSAQSFKWSGPVPLFHPHHSMDDINMQKLAEAASQLSADEMGDLVSELEKRFSKQDPNK
jgi:hypothetical protein